MLSLLICQRQPAIVLAFSLGLSACARPLPSAGVPLEPVYCYRTIADMSCYTAPDAGREGQLVGVYLRDAGDPGWPDWWLRRAAPTGTGAYQNG
jgi:hypothetical protein